MADCGGCRVLKEELKAMRDFMERRSIESKPIGAGIGGNTIVVMVWDRGTIGGIESMDNL